MSQNISMEQIKQLLEDTLKQREDALKQQLEDALKKHLEDALKKQLEDALKKQLEVALQPISTKLDDLSKAMNSVKVNVSILSAKQQNSTATLSDRLHVVPLSDGSLPTGPFPDSIQQLLVAGNESLPDGQRSSWNKKKSLALLRQYEDASDLESETDDNESTSKSRARRLKLSRHLGISIPQLNFAQMAL